MNLSAWLSDVTPVKLYKILRNFSMQKMRRFATISTNLNIAHQDFESHWSLSVSVPYSKNLVGVKKLKGHGWSKEIRDMQRTDVPANNRIVQLTRQSQSMKIASV